MENRTTSLGGGPVTIPTAVVLPRTRRRNPTPPRPRLARSSVAWRAAGSDLARAPGQEGTRGGVTSVLCTKVEQAATATEAALERAPLTSLSRGVLAGVAEGVRGEEPNTPRRSLPLPCRRLRQGSDLL